MDYSKYGRPLTPGASGGPTCRVHGCAMRMVMGADPQYGNPPVYNCPVEGCKEQHPPKQQLPQGSSGVRWPKPGEKW